MSKPRALVLHAAGTNRDPDACVALEMAGAAPEIVHVNALHSGERRLADYAMLVIPGGFSYADALGAGRLFALDLASYFADEVAGFVAAGKRHPPRDAEHPPRDAEHPPRDAEHPPRGAGHPSGDARRRDACAQREWPIRMQVDDHGRPPLQQHLDKGLARPAVMPDSPRRGPFPRRAGIDHRRAARGRPAGAVLRGCRRVACRRRVSCQPQRLGRRHCGRLQPGRKRARPDASPGEQRRRPRPRRKVQASVDPGLPDALEKWRRLCEGPII
ncbi:MAG: hypothetical protein CVV51_11485 [Spirochaetae bacterium HGW-Spirochaetae-7]|nr:MAG: hypothetical protein CVV51_11485 [Spirochaetae bacterium HGW-Spirochaetae-7]